LAAPALLSLAAALATALTAAAPAADRPANRAKSTAHPALLTSDGAASISSADAPAARQADQADPATIPIDPGTLALVVDLDAADYERRETVTRRLLGDDVPISQLYAALAQAALNAEQRYRLLDVLRERLVNTPRGALGIGMQPGFPVFPMNGEPAEIKVERLIEGLPAREVLRINDRIQRINGQVLRHGNDLRRIVESHKPGERLTLTILRPRTNEHDEQILVDDRVVYDSIDVEIVLGSAELLGEPTLADSQIRTERRMKAQQAAMQFAPPARQVVSPPAELTRQPNEDPLLSAYIDADPDIQQILDDRRALRNGDLPVTAQLARRWQATRNRLDASSREPGLSPGVAQYRRRVAARYAELIPVD
jgi:hypothetical protein